MLVIFYLLLMLRGGRCTEDQMRQIETETVNVGDDVKLKCSRKNTGSLFWIRLVSGYFPEVLGKTYSPHSVDPRIKTSEEPGEFVLHIEKTSQSDTGLYYCLKIKTTKQNLIFLKGTDLRIVESAHDISSVPPSDRVGPTDSVPLQYSVLSDSDNKLFPGDPSMCLFGDRLDESHPSFNNIQGSSIKENEGSSEGLSMKNCIYSFFKDISSSDAGNCYCAVATCGEIVCANRSTLNSEAINLFDSQENNVILSLFCVALATSLIIIAFLLCSIKKLKEKSCHCNAAVALQTVGATDHQTEQTDEDSLVYSAPIFNIRKLSKAERRDEKTEEEETIYTDVRALGLDGSLTT